MNRQSGKITALYCRLAQYDSDFDLLTARNQQEILLNYAIEHGLENPCFYCDWGFSGTNLKRPEFQRMLREIKAGNVSNIAVINVSRLGRKMLDCGKLINDIFPKYGVTFHSVQDGTEITEYLARWVKTRKSNRSPNRKSKKGERS